MKHHNIYSNDQAGHSVFSDERGTIADIFYAREINHGCLITNAPGAVRGNHFHQFTTQYVLILEGSLTYFSRSLHLDDLQVFEGQPGDVIMSPPNEIHAMRAGDQGCKFLAFAEGPRGGQDYEADTYRVDSIIPQ